MVVELIVLIIITLIIILFYIFRFQIFNFTDDFGVIKGNYGTYSKENISTCISFNGKCNTPGTQVLTQECIPNPDNFRGCISSKGRQTYNSVIKTIPCLSSCRSSLWETENFSPCLLQDTGVDIKCIDPSQKGIKTLKKTCIANDATGVNACTYNISINNGGLQNNVPDGCILNNITSIVTCEVGSSYYQYESCNTPLRIINPSPSSLVSSLINPLFNSTGTNSLDNTNITKNLVPYDICGNWNINKNSVKSLFFTNECKSFTDGNFISGDTNLFMNGFRDIEMFCLNAENNVTSCKNLDCEKSLAKIQSDLKENIVSIGCPGSVVSSTKSFYNTIPSGKTSTSNPSSSSNITPVNPLNPSPSSGANITGSNNTPSKNSTLSGTNITGSNNIPGKNFTLLGTASNTLTSNIPSSGTNITDTNNTPPNTTSNPSSQKSIYNVIPKSIINKSIINGIQTISGIKIELPSDIPSNEPYITQNYTTHEPCIYINSLSGNWNPNIKKLVNNFSYITQDILLSQKLNTIFLSLNNIPCSFNNILSKTSIKTITNSGQTRLYDCFGDPSSLLKNTPCVFLNATNIFDNKELYTITNSCNLIDIIKYTGLLVTIKPTRNFTGDSNIIYCNIIAILGKNYRGVLDYILGNLVWSQIDIYNLAANEISITEFMLISNSDGTFNLRTSKGDIINVPVGNEPSNLIGTMDNISFSYNDTFIENDIFNVDKFNTFLANRETRLNPKSCNAYYTYPVPNDYTGI